MPAWSWARISIVNAPLSQSIAAEALRMITALPPQELSTLAWSWAKLLLIDLPLLDAISAAALSLI
eukprot:CAMPEP_0180676746 /NCGR_PEP_ID=MMETSP1037_2-20121125/67485_1 /TAXON_ID=632150 /ORGANISM="Azadinium spinosum, Strain 3D9" /LENGTH=65 /DNA_ID=CAMNT_0022706287 /DNA_START=27 /DNA_END=221 /DNA_ORIENTATION=-